MKGAVPARPEEEGGPSPRVQPTPFPGDDASHSSDDGAQLHTGTAPAHLRIFIPGLPKPQGSMKAFMVGGRPRITHSKPTDLNAWRSAISLGVYELWGDHPALEGPLIVVLDFWLPRPKSAPKRRQHPDGRPDIDKLARAVLDALTGIVFRDDAQVVRLVADKHFAIERATGADIYVSGVDL